MSIWNFWKSNQKITDLEEQVESLQKEINDYKSNQKINDNLITKEYIIELAENVPNDMEWVIWTTDATLHFYDENGDRLKDTFITVDFKNKSICAWSDSFTDKIYNLYLNGLLVFTKDNLNMFIDIFTKLIESELK